MYKNTWKKNHLNSYIKQEKQQALSTAVGMYTKNKVVLSKQELQILK